MIEDRRTKGCTRAAGRVGFKWLAPGPPPRDPGRCCWLVLELFLPYTGWKNRIRWKIGVERLQEWAVSTMDSYDAIERPEAINDIPDDIRSVLPNAFVVPETTIVQRHIWFPVDPKRDSHGFWIGRREFVPLPTKHLTDKLADGVWGYYPDSGLW